MRQIIGIIINNSIAPIILRNANNQYLFFITKKNNTTTSTEAYEKITEILLTATGDANCGI